MVNILLCQNVEADGCILIGVAAGCASRRYLML